MTQIQIEISKLIHYILNSTFYRENYSKPGLKDILAQAIRQFPEITSDNKKTWKDIDLYRSNLKISERGAKIIDDNYGQKDLWKLLHYEHIIPVSSTVKNLLNLGEKPKLNDVIKVMEESEVIILSKEEANILDGDINKLYPLEGEMVCGKGMRAIGSKKERLDSVKIKIDKKYRNNIL